MRIRDILRSKGSAVITIAPDLPLQQAMQVLVQHNIGALVVSDGSIQGIISERDLLRAGAAGIEQLVNTRVHEVMTAEVITAAPDADIQDVMGIMTEHRIRHLPVVDGGELCGMISIGDVVSALRSSVESENKFLHAYIEGRPL